MPLNINLFKVPSKSVYPRAYVTQQAGSIGRDLKKKKDIGLDLKRTTHGFHDFKNSKKRECFPDTNKIP